MITEKINTDLVSEFKKALEKFDNQPLSLLYQKLFFSIFISEQDLSAILEYYRTVFLKEPDDWFRQFHKSIRQTDFFEGSYLKFVKNKAEEVPIAGIADSILYNLIHLDDKNELKNAMETAFKS